MRHGLAALVLGALITTSSTATAATTAADPVGQPCGLAAVDDPQVEGSRTGLLRGGPMTGDGTLTCTVQVNAATHAGPDAASASAVGTSVVVIWPSTVTYGAAEADVTYVCTAFATDKERLYWSGSSWSTDPNTSCERIITTEDIPLTPVKDLADPVVCPVVAAAAPGVPGVVDVSPEGDVTVAGRPRWDCPPYDDEPDVLSSHFAGGITITDNGSGPVWTATGDFATPLWSCYDTSPGYANVQCDYVGGGYPPSCDQASALAIALPTLSSSGTAWGTAETWAICEGDLVAEFLSSGLANQSAPSSFGTRAMVHQHVTRVYCTAHDGSHAQPVPSYLADCQFTF